MTDKDVRRMLNRLANNGSAGTRKKNQNNNLMWIMKLMYYCHLKMNDALKVCRGNLIKTKKGCFGTYIYSKEGLEDKAMVFEIYPSLFKELVKYVSSNESEEQYVITVKKRTLQKAFRDLANEMGIEGRLIDVMYAGEKYFTKTKSPYEM